TVVIHLKSAYSPLTAQLADRAGMIMSPKQLAKLGANFAQDPICVGPFMYSNRVAGDSITVVKSPYYYDKKDVHLAKIVFKVDNDTAAAAAALKAGDQQALDGIDSTQLQGIESDSSLGIIKQTSLGYQGFTINIGNKNGIDKLPYSNIGTDMPGCTPISPASAYFDKTIKCTPYDPADAKKLVAASGISNPTVNLMVPTGTAALRLAQFIQAEEKAVGITVNIQSTDFVTSLDKEEDGTFDTYLIGWSGRIDPDGNIYAFAETSGTENGSGYSNPRLDYVLNNARKSATQKSRMTLYHVAEQIIENDRPLIYLYYPVTRAGVSKQVTGVKMYPDTLLRVAFAQFK